MAELYSKRDTAITGVITSEGIWIEGEAIRQLEEIAGLPELHPGKGIPVGAVFATAGIFHPHLVGNDVGCGMGLWKTNLKVRKIKLDRWVARLDLETAPSPDEIASRLEREGIEAGVIDPGLGFPVIMPWVVISSREKAVMLKKGCRRKLSAIITRNRIITCQAATESIHPNKEILRSGHPTNIQHH